MSATNPASIQKNERLTEASEATANGDEEFGDFQIRPSLTQSFQRADVRAIIVDVFQQVLDGEYTRSKVTLRLKIMIRTFSHQAKSTQNLTWPHGANKLSTRSIHVLPN